MATIKGLPPYISTHEKILVRTTALNAAAQTVEDGTVYQEVLRIANAYEQWIWEGLVEPEKGK